MSETKQATASNTAPGQTDVENINTDAADILTAIGKVRRMISDPKMR